jgi:hypothetical protein
MLSRAFRYLYLAFLSQPAGERVLYRHLRRHAVGRILELGIGNAERAKRLIDFAARTRRERIHYTGVDLFEMRSPEDGNGISLKLAHRQLAATGARVRLVPGEPYAALASTANSLKNQDLVLISADQNAESVEAAWFYLPRVLAKPAAVFCELPPTGDRASQFRQLTSDEIHRLTKHAHRRRAA